MDHAHHDRVGGRLLADLPQEGVRKADAPAEEAAHPAAGIAQVGDRAVLVDDHAALFIELVGSARDGTAEQRLELVFADVFCLAAVIAGELGGVVRDRGLGAGALDAALQAQICAGRADVHLVLAPFFFPCIRLDVEVAERALVEGDLDLFALARLEGDFREALELVRGTEQLAVLFADVHLRDLGAVALAGIFDGEGDTVFIDFQAGILEGRVAETEAEWIAHRHARRIIVAVADVEAFAVLDARRLAGEAGRGGAVFVLFGIALCEFAGGVDFAGEHAEDGARARLTAQVRVYDGGGAVRALQFDRAAAAQHHDDGLVQRVEQGEHLALVGGDLHIHAVDALGLADFVEAHKEDDLIRLGGESHRLFGELAVGLAVPLVALSVTDVVDGIFADAVDDVVQLGRVDDGRARALVAGVLGEVADDADLFVFVEREGVFLVFEKDHARFRALFCKDVVRLFVEFLRRGLDDFVGGQNEVEQAVEQLVDDVLVQLAVLDALCDRFVLRGVFFDVFGDGVALGERLDDVVRAVAAAGHFELVAGDGALHAVIAARPVGDDHAVVAPIAAEDVLHQVHILVGVGAVELVVRGHDGARLALFDGDLEPGEVDLAQGALVDDGVDDHAALLLVVGGKVLDAAGDALLLDAAHVRRSHFAGEVRVLREVLEVTAAQRAALDVHARAEQDVDFHRSRFLAEELAQLFAQLGIPAVCHRRRRGVAGRRDARVEAEVVGGRRLFAQAVRAVGQVGRRDTQLVDVQRRPEITARHKVRFLLYAQLRDDVRILELFFHLSLPPFSVSADAEKRVSRAILPLLDVLHGDKFAPPLRVIISYF